MIKLIFAIIVVITGGTIAMLRTSKSQKSSLYLLGFITGMLATIVLNS